MMNASSTRCATILLGFLLAALAIGASLFVSTPAARADTQEVIWSQPSRDAGSKISSEDIPAYALRSEVANDFSYPSNAVVTKVRWWGGPYRASDGPEPVLFNIYVYDDASCKPGQQIDAYLEVQPTSTQTGTDPGGLPIYRYDAYVSFAITGGQTYWISVQAASHDSPPQWGRQEATNVQGCESMIRSDYFGFPDWTLCSVPAHHPWDASEEIEINTATIEACCLTFGLCEMTLPDSCTAHGGSPQGPGSVCIPNPCPEPLQACCALDGTCTMQTATDCLIAGGIPQGFGTTCDPNPCADIEACCLFGSCQMLYPTQCTEFGGTPQGPDTGCDPDPCAPPEACCFPDGHCEMATPSACLGQGGIPWGTGTTCDANPCPQPEPQACCAPDGGCTLVLPDACIGSGGTPGGTGSTCDPNVCPIVIRTRPTTWGGIKALFR